MGDEGAGWLAEALASNSSLTEVILGWHSYTRSLVGAHLDRNKGNLEKKSTSLFLMLLPSLSLDDAELSEKTILSLDICPSIYFWEHLYLTDAS